MSSAFSNSLEEGAENEKILWTSTLQDEQFFKATAQVFETLSFSTLLLCGEGQPG